MTHAEFFTRRTVPAMMGAMVPAFGARAAAGPAFETMRPIERRTGGRLGVAAMDTATGARMEYRADERFAMCSTFKFLAVAAVLHRAEKDKAGLERFIKYGPGDLLSYAPVAKAHVKEGRMTLAALCAAAIELSDNTAANLLLAQLGGPSGVTQFARTLGDPVTRLDRIEIALNTAIPGDPRDTTSPAAMLRDMQALLLEDKLSGNSRHSLTEWMLACKTADARLRAGLPKDWRVGSKTGTGGNHTFNEVAILWPPGRKPILVASYLTEAKVPDAACDAAHADVARVIVNSLP